MSHPDPLHDPENELPEDPDLTDIVDLSEIKSEGVHEIVIDHTNGGKDAKITITK